MRFLILVGAFVSAWPCLSGANVRECQSYLLAPKGYKVHTRELLRAGKPEQVRLREDQLTAFVNTTPVGDPKIVAYLTALRRDASDIETASEGLITLSERLLNVYLMRPGNEELSLASLDQFLETYWLDFAWGPDDIRQIQRMAHGFAWTDQHNQFIERAARQYPEQVKTVWIRSMRKALPHLIKMDEVQRSFAAAEKYMQEYARQSDEEIREDDLFFENRENTDNVVENRERLNYIRDLIAEIEAPISAKDVASLLKFYKIGDPPFSGNGTFMSDEADWRAPDLEFTSPSHGLVYLMRLSRRLGFAPPEIVQLEDSMKRLKEMLRNYPRPSRGGGYAAAGRI